MSSQPGRSVEQVLLDFQSVMEQFLLVQRDVLALYYGEGRPRGLTAAAPAVTPAAPESAQNERRGVEPPEEGGRLPVQAPQPPETEPLTNAAGERAPEAAAHVASRVRLALSIASRPLGAERGELARGHAILLTDDENGVATALARRLRHQGYRVAVLGTSPAAAEEADRYTCSFGSAADIEAAVHGITASCGAIGALVHLLPLKPAPAPAAIDVAGWWERLSIETRGFFLLSQALRSSLERAAEAGGAVVIGATAMGGSFAVEPGAAFLPGQGGIGGLTKCLAIEWPHVRVRSVDLDPGESPERLAAQLYDELWATDAEREIGYTNGRRVGLDLTPADAIFAPGFAIPSDAVILATGGARGITAEICLDLAERFQPTLILVGQSPLPEAIEPADTAGCTAPVDLKRALMSRLAKDGSRPTVAMVERAYARLLRDREIRETIGGLSAVGARVHYVPLDVRNDEALAALVDEVYATYGRLDGLIHGAGIIEDKLVQHKSVESFDRVLETKARSAFVLSSRVRPESLRFAIFFGSVAGRFGNRGQSDYAAANEVVSKLAVLLQRRWPARVCSINWAPWDKRGMVSPELKREFMRRGVGLLDPSAGRRAFWEEIQQGRSDPAEVVVAASPRPALVLDAPPAVAEASADDPPPFEPMPMMRDASSVPGSASAVRYARSLNPDVDLFLLDHQLDGHGVLPLAVATELIAEAAQRTWPDLTVSAVRDLRLLKGIVVADGPLPLLVAVQPPVAPDGLRITAGIEISTPGAAPELRYRALVDLDERAPEAPPFTPPSPSLRTFPLPLVEAYRVLTFHGPAFQRLTGIDGLNEQAIRGHVYSSSTAVGIRGVKRAGWHIDPYVFDCALQLLLMWSRAQNDKTALPSRFRAFRRFGTLSDTPLTCHIAVETLAGGHALRSDVHFVGPDGRVLAILEGMEASCTAALNRLAVRA